MGFVYIDYVIFVVYGVLILFIGFWVFCIKKGEIKIVEDYFLVGKFLLWWVIGVLLIVVNILVEQFIGMFGFGFVIGLVIVFYEWMVVFMLFIVGKYFLFVFIKKGFYIIFEFVE